jgi:predicted naringenin-chalcone synthase
MRRRLQRFGCDPTRIAQRGHSVPDIGGTTWNQMRIYDVTRDPRGQGTAERNALFAEVVDDYFENSYRDALAPADLIHVTCTGYVSPSGAQKLVAARGWGGQTRVAHAYHMGCYAAFPALRIGAGFLEDDTRVDIAHTEICTVHLDPSDHTPEQLVVQSLFADGFIRYSLRAGGPGLEVLAQDEAIIPDSGELMGWVVGDHSMQMTLGREVPDRIGGPLSGFVAGLYARAAIEPSVEGSIFAIHPGGPRIIDQVAEVLGLRDDQVAASRAILREHGNMSSATLPHVWKRLLEDPAVAVGMPIVSMGFGPGLTIAGGLFRKA